MYGAAIGRQAGQEGAGKDQDKGGVEKHRARSSRTLAVIINNGDKGQCGPKQREPE